ncbi:MAG: pantoate--beta-alanine ligase [Candidatus Binatia bacterium]
MKIITDIPKMQEFARQVRVGGLSIGLVPTMGSLHEGHLALVRCARSEADVVVASIFVNPKQFDRDEDFAAYPRDEERDRALLEQERVDVLFMPTAQAVYGERAATRVSVSGLSDHLCGPVRPGHFDGVTTIVTALFNMVLPDLAFFGEKDYQQLQIIRRMTRDLHLPVRIVSLPTVREADGLAMSSRNERLGEAGRKRARALSLGLEASVAEFAAGEDDADALIATARVVVEKTGGIDIEYLELVDGDTLGRARTADERSVIAIAAWVDGVRLIDNVVFSRWLSQYEETPAEEEATGPNNGVHTDA